MAITQDRSLRKPTGGRNKSTRPKRLHMTGNKPSLTVIGEKRRLRNWRMKGGSEKKGLLSIGEVNLYDPKSKKHVKAKIKVVKESASNRNYVRRNIITKGTIIETDKGLAKVTNRPGQERSLNAIMISQEK